MAGGSGGDKMKRKVTIGDNSKTSQGDTTPPRRPSVFERLGPGSSGLPSSDTHGTSYSEKCRNWLRTGNCEYGRSCKYQHGPFGSANKKGKGEKQGSRMEENDSGIKERKKKGTIRNMQPKLISPPNKKNRRRSKTRAHKQEPESKIKSTVVVTRPTDKERDEDDTKGKKWGSDKSHLDFQEELDLEKRRQQLQRELALEMQKERMLQEREKVIVQKTVSSSSSSTASSSSSRSSSSSSSSDDNGHGNSSSSDDSTDSNAKPKTKRIKCTGRRFPPLTKDEEKTDPTKKPKEKPDPYQTSKSKTRQRRISRSPIPTSPKNKGPRTPSPPPKHRHRSPEPDKDRNKTTDKYRKKRSSSIPDDESRKPGKRWSKSPPPTPDQRRSPSPINRKSRRSVRTPSPTLMKKIKKKSLSPEKTRKVITGEKTEKSHRSISKEKEPIHEIRPPRSYSLDRHPTHRSLSPREERRNDDKEKKRRPPLRDTTYKKTRDRRDIVERRNKSRDRTDIALPRERELGDIDRKRNIDVVPRRSPFRRGAGGSPAKRQSSIDRDSGGRRKLERDREEKMVHREEKMVHREERRDDIGRLKRKELDDDVRVGYHKGRDIGESNWDWNRGQHKGHDGRRSGSRERRVDEVHRDHRRGFDERGKHDVRRDDREREVPLLRDGQIPGRRHKERVREAPLPPLEKNDGRRRVNQGKVNQVVVKDPVVVEKGRRRRRTGWEGRRGRGKGNRSARRAALRGDVTSTASGNKQEPQWKKRDDLPEPRKRARTGDRLPSPPSKHGRSDMSPTGRSSNWAEPPHDDPRDTYRERDDWNVVDRKRPERIRETEVKPEMDLGKEESGNRRRESRKRRRSHSREDKRDEKRLRMEVPKDLIPKIAVDETSVKSEDGVFEEGKGDDVIGVEKDNDGLSDWSDDDDEILNRVEDVDIKETGKIEEPERKDLIELIERSSKGRSSSQEKDGGRSRTRERASHRSQPTSRNTSIERHAVEKIVPIGGRSRSDILPPKEEEVVQLSDTRVENSKEKETENTLDNDDYEAISDDDLETLIEDQEEDGVKLEKETKSAVDSLEVDWSCLTAKPKPKSDVVPGSVLRRFTAVRIFSRIGILPKYSGDQLLKKVKTECEKQLKEEAKEREKQSKTETESEEKIELSLTFEPSYSNTLLFAKIKDSEEKNSILADVGTFRRALCARRDLQLRKQLYKPTEKIPALTPQSFDSEMYKLSVQLFKQRKIEQGKNIASVC